MTGEGVHEVFQYATQLSADAPARSKKKKADVPCFRQYTPHKEDVGGVGTVVHITVASFRDISCA